MSDVDFGALLRTEEGIRDPYPIYAELRRTGRVIWSDAVSAWLISTYPQVQEAFRDSARFSNANRKSSRIPADVQERARYVTLAHTIPALANADAPLHTRNRAPFAKWLNPRRIAAKEAWFTQRCNELADNLAAQETPDLIAHYGSQLSFESILELFGAPTDQLELYKQASEARSKFFVPVGAPNFGAADAYDDALERVYDTVTDVCRAARRAGNTDTVIGTLVNADKLDAEQPFSPDEIFSILTNFFTAATENIAHSIGTAFVGMLQERPQFELVRKDLRLASGAFEEAVRWDTPNHGNLRTARNDTEFGGASMKAGDTVILFKASANRDPSVWTNPDAYDIMRDQTEPSAGTVAFGQGPHFCIGAGLARIEVPIAIGTLIKRFPRMHLPDEWQPDWLMHPGQHMLASLPVVLD